MHQPKQFALGVCLKQRLLLRNFELKHRSEEVSKAHRVVRLNNDISDLCGDVGQKRERLLHEQGAPRLRVGMRQQAALDRLELRGRIVEEARV